jgi:3-hydroxyisobutyrate dehydrogenase
VLDILAAGAGNSGVLGAKKEKLTREDWGTHFSVALIHKDLTYLQDLIGETHGSNVLLGAVQELFGRSMEKYADLDFSAVYNIAKEQDHS